MTTPQSKATTQANERRPDAGRRDSSEVVSGHQVARRGRSTGEWAVLSVTLGYLAAWLPFALIVRNREFVFYFAVMCILVAVVWRIQAHLRLHLAALWCLSLWGLLHMGGGLMPIPSWWPRGGESLVLYNAWLIPGMLKFDQLVHAGGLALLTWICWQGVQQAFARRGVTVRPTLSLMTLCVAASLGAGSATEVVEFIATLIVPETNVGDYQNTGWDLVANLVGSVLAASVIYFRSLSGVRSQESGVRSQESGVTSHESRVRGQESGVRITSEG